MGRSKHDIVRICIDCSSTESDETTIDVDSIESEDIIIVDKVDKIDKRENPKAIVKKLVGDKQVVANGDDIVSKMFTYEEADVLVVLDAESKPWYKGKDICDILEYNNTKRAITTNVDEKYKKQYADLINKGSAKRPLEKVHAQTIFISNSGVFQLVSRSKKPEAIKLWEFITETILPELFAKGTYSLPTKQTDIARLTKNFYDDNMLSNYKDILAVYLAYIGEYNGKHILKFGKSNDFVRRDLMEHRKMYKTFNVIKIWETLANDLVETNIKYNFMSKNMLTTLTKKELNIKCNEQTKRELVILNEVNDLDYCLNMINTVVNTTVLPQELKYKNEIKNMVSNQEFIELKHKNELLESKIEHLEEMNTQLKGNINDLRNRRKKR